MEEVGGEPMGSPLSSELYRPIACKAVDG